MFATRRDQENVVHAQQTAAAAKHADSKASMPKTPAQASKTPFRSRRHDENATQTVRVDGKVKTAVAALEGKSARPKSNVFATPAQPQTRAPLGVKTGNTKAAAFQTPARPLTVQQPITQRSSPRFRRARFQVHDAAVEVANVQPEEREIEYIHPREVPLLDYPDPEIWQHDRTYSQFEGENFSRGWTDEAFNEEMEEDFLTRITRAEKKEASQKQALQVISAKGAPGTLVARQAALALSKARGSGSFAAATTASAARSRTNASSTLVGSMTKSSVNNPRHVIAKNVSRTTLGFTKGREVNAQQHLDAIHKQYESQDFDLVTAEARNAVLDAMWTHTEADDAEADCVPPMDMFDLEDLKNLTFSIPDD